MGRYNVLLRGVYRRRQWVVEKFTRKLLVERPGLKVGAALDEVELVDGKINQTNLYRKLKANQNNIFPAVNVPYSGLTLSCEVNGEAANFYGSIGAGDKKFYSQEVAVKSVAADNANDDLRTRFDEIFALKNSGGFNDALKLDKNLLPIRLLIIGGIWRFCSRRR